MRTALSAGTVWVLCAGGLWAEDAPKKGALPAADFKLTAGEYAKAFKKDAKAAREKYQGKVIELSGTVVSAAPGFAGNGSYVSLETPDPAVMFDNPDALCFSDDPNFFAQFGRGQTARIKGRFGPAGLASCEVVEKGADTIVRATAEALAKDFTADRQKAQAKYDRKTLVVTGTVAAIKPVPGLKIKSIELTGDGKTVIECRYGDPQLVEKLKVGQTVTLYSGLVSGGDGKVGVELCYPLAK